MKILESNLQDPSYSIVISKFDQPTFCNKDQLKMYIEQFNPNLETIIENNQKNIERLKNILIENNISIPNDLNVIEINNCIKKTLVIDSILDYSKEDNMYISGLTGIISDETEKGITHRLVRGQIKDKQLSLTENDIPNYFNKAKFKIKGNQFIISVPKKVKNLELVIKKNSTLTEKCYDDDGNLLLREAEEKTEIYSEENISKNQIIIPINLCRWNYDFSLSYDLKEDLTFKNIESITTPLKSTIKIKFSNKYDNLPAVILTIDEDKKVYSDYSTKFTVEDLKYTGVTIELKGFKRQKEYGDINITVIGSKRQEEDLNDSNG